MRPRFPLLGVVLLVIGCAAPTPAAEPEAAPGAATASPTVHVDSSSAPASIDPTATMTPTTAASREAKPEADSWVEAGSFIDGRSIVRLAILDESGQVMAVGDDVACGLESAASATTELYDMDTNTWHSGPRMPSGRHGPAVAALPAVRGTAARVLVTGGSNQEYVAKSGTVLYDPSAKVWSRSGLLNTARIDPAIAVVAGGRVLVAGGLLIDLDQSGRALDSAEVWDPESGTWARTGSMSGPRYGPMAVTLDDGRVLVVGGLPAWGADDQRRSADLYDPMTGRWRSAGELAETPAWISLVATADHALAVYAPAHGRTLRAERFDPGRMAWSSVGDSNIPFGEGRAASVTLRDDRVLVVSGDQVWILEPGGTWTRAQSLPDGPRNDASAVLLGDGSVLVAGGWSIGTPPDETGGCETPNRRAWRYIPAAGGPE